MTRATIPVLIGLGHHENPPEPAHPLGGSLIPEKYIPSRPNSWQKSKGASVRYHIP